MIQKGNTHEEYGIIRRLRSLAAWGLILTLAYMYFKPYLGDVNEIFNEIKTNINEEFSGEYGPEYDTEKDYEVVIEEATDIEVEEDVTVETEAESIDGFSIETTIYPGVLYLGCVNKLKLRTPGNTKLINSELRYSSNCGKVIPGPNGNLFATISKPEGNCTIKVEVNDKEISQTFKIEKIPDPVAQLGRSTGGAISAGEFKAQAGVIPVLEDFKLDARCTIIGYKVIHSPTNGPTGESKNMGARFNDKSRRLTSMAKSGDKYTFNNIMARCPGDSEGRLLPEMVFEIR